MPWDGDLATATRDESKTTINIRVFADLVEEIVQRVRSSSDELELVLVGGVPELIARYTFGFGTIRLA